MKYFAQVKESRIVNVIVVADSVLLGADGVEDENLGSEFCKGFGDGRWVQVSETGEFRKMAAGIGDIYREDVDAFQPPREYESWSFNDDSWAWEPPVPMPTDGGLWIWNEDAQIWERIELNG